MKIGYTSGTFYKKFKGSNMSRMNRQIVSNNLSNINNYGTSVFSTKQAQTESLNEMIVKKVAEKLQAEAQQKLKQAASMNALKGLGAFTDTSA